MKNIFNILILAVAIVAPISFVSCSESDEIERTDYSVAKKQLAIDYSEYNLTDITWSTVLGYQVANFNFTTKAANSSASVNAWYSVNNDSATREKSTENIGVTIPDIIKTAFEETVYFTAAWEIEEIEIEMNYNGNALEEVYEVELKSTTNKKIVAELYFNAKTGVLLYSRESIAGNDNNSNNNDSIVISDELAAAVKAIHPTAIIINAEIEDNQIEVEVVVTENGIAKEIEMIFSMTYVYHGSETEYEVTYGELSEDFYAVKEWFANTQNGFPIPPNETMVEIEEGNLQESEINYIWGLEIEYVSSGIDYEVEFFLDADFKIVNVKVDH